MLLKLARRAFLIFSVILIGPGVASAQSCQVNKIQTKDTRYTILREEEPGGQCVEERK